MDLDMDMEVNGYIYHYMVFIVYFIVARSVENNKVIGCHYSDSIMLAFFS